MTSIVSIQAIAFLQNSFLSNQKASANLYKDYNDEQLRQELLDYRKIYAASETDIAYPRHNSMDLRTCIERDGDFTDEQIIKQLILYMDQIVIEDPLTALVLDNSAGNLSFNRLLGLQSDGSIDRKKLRDAVFSIGILQKAIEERIVLLAPNPAMEKETEIIPLKYSRTAFSGILPHDIEEHYRSKAIVHNMVRRNGTLVIDLNAPLEVGDLINVSFDKEEAGVGYCYMGAKAASKADNTVLLSMIPGEGLTEDIFNRWVFQSVNQAAIKHFEKVIDEVVFSHLNKALYLSRKSSTADLLKMITHTENREAELANMAMKMDLPVLSKIPLDALIDIRKNHGDAFYSFRSALKGRLNQIDYSANAAEISRQISEIEYELTHTEIEKINQEYNNLGRKIKYDLAALGGSLLFSALDNGTSLVGAALSATKTMFDVAKYSEDIHGSGGYFMWRINKCAKKYSV